VSAAALNKKFNIDFTANVQNQRGALAIVHNRVPCRFHLYYCCRLTCVEQHRLSMSDWTQHADSIGLTCTVTGFDAHCSCLSRTEAWQETAAPTVGEPCSMH
jgi:hypothetical protein